MGQNTVSDLDIQALVDNELSWEDEKRIRMHLQNDPRARARFELLRQQKNLLNDWWSTKKSH